MKNILIDCDPGHDDVMAILSVLAHSKELNLLGITTVCGNNLCERITENTLNVLSYLNRRDIPVSMGALRPLMYDPEPQNAHGYNGLEGFEFPKPDISITKERAVEFLKDQLLSHDKVTILALAPLTNLALLLRSYPEVKEHIEEIILMGGSIYRGNILPRAEFNIYADPHSAEIMINCGVPVTILPLEGCDYCTIKEEDITYWKNKNGHVSKMVAGIMDFFAGYGRSHGMSEFTVFDLGTAMYVLHPEIFKSYTCTCHVVTEGKYTRGMTVIDKVDTSNIKVLVHADKEKFREYIRQDIDYLDAQY